MISNETLINITIMYLRIIGWHTTWTAVKLYEIYNWTDKVGRINYRNSQSLEEIINFTNYLHK